MTPKGTATNVYMADGTQMTSWEWYAVDYGKQAKRSIELAKTRGMWADISGAYNFARKAFHFGAKELDRQLGDVKRCLTFDAR